MSLNLVILGLCGNVGGVGLFRSVKRAELDFFSFDADQRIPARTERVGSPQPRFAFFLGMLVQHVFLKRHVPKIAPSVIVSNAVDVVNGVTGPLPSHIQPCKTMRRSLCSVNAYAPVFIGVEIPGEHSRFAHLASTHAPRKNPGLLVIVQKFAQTFCGKIGLSHDAVLSLIGQRPSGVSALAGLRHFNTGGA